MQMVVVDGDQFSNLCEITSGVPQGSVLGPILFLVYTADMFKVVKTCKMKAFADDTQLTHSFKTEQLPEASLAINNDLKEINKYADQNNLKLNASKCTVMCFGQKNKVSFIKENLKLFIGQTELLFSDKAKNLGLTLEQDLRFKTQIAFILKKAYFALRPLYLNRNIINFILRKKLCESLVLPSLNRPIQFM